MKGRVVKMITMIIVTLRVNDTNSYNCIIITIASMSDNNPNYSDSDDGGYGMIMIL